MRLVAIVSVFVGALAAAPVVALTAHKGLGPIVVAVLVVALRAFDIFASFELQPKENDATWQVGEALLVVAVVVLQPCGALATMLLGLAAGMLASRVSPVKVLLNLGAEAAAVASGIAVYSVFGSGQTFGTAALLGGAAAALAYTVVGIAVAAPSIAYRTGASLHDAVPRGTLVLIQWTCAVSLGLVTAASCQVVSWAPVLAVAPVALVQSVLNEHFHARKDRARLDGLFRAATQAHASVLTQEVEQALNVTAAELLKCEGATVELVPPVSGQIGARLASTQGTETWLVAHPTSAGKPFDDEDIRLLDALGAIGSSALENARLVEEIRRQAINDPLTGLANQTLFEDRVAQAVAAAWRTRERFVVLVLDLDAFKRVNDSLGHTTGNELLRLVGQRLVESVRDVDTVARLGGDHFTILIPGIGTPQTAGVLAEKLLNAIRRPVDLAGQQLFMTASAGLAFFPDDGTHGEHLLRNADSAMHRAKALGKDGYQVYAAGMNEQAHLRLARETELHNALDRGELRVRYQPQIELRTGRICGVEALVRWDHPVLGLVGPHDFVPLAEESGLIIDIDEWVLNAACEQAVDWIAEGLPPVRVAVNLSGRHFQATDRVVDTVVSVIERTGIDARNLELEVTERIAVGESDDAIEALQRIRALGVSVAIDDFGTGYSMLGRLQRFPIDRLKIDRTFVREIESAHGEAPIVAAMIAMARSLRLEVVAEGVETLEQQTFLRHHSCDQAQGFLFSHAVEPAEIARLLKTPSVGFNLTAVS